MTASTPRFSMKKRFLAPVAVMATIPAALALALPAQAANGVTEPPCTPSEATGAVFGDWTPSDEFTDWQESNETPADPDSEAGDDNPLNLKQIGEGEHQWVLGGFVTQTTDWLREKPAGDGWSVNATKLVTDKAAYNETISQAVDQWYHWNGSYQSTAPAPPPAAGWGPDNGSHNGLKNKPDYAPNKVFDASVKGGNNASWFFHGLKGAVIVHHDAVTHIEYRYERQVEAEGHTVYRWSVEERTYTPGELAVECPPAEEPGVDPTDPTDPTTPEEPSTPSVPTEVKGQTAQTTSSGPSVPNQPMQSHAPGTNPAAVPLSIDAGL